MKFKDKVYIITLALFLLFLNAGIFSLAYYTFQKASDSAKVLCYSEQAVIVEAFEDDVKYLGNAGRAQVMKFYGRYYEKKDIRLCFDYYGEQVYSNLPEGIEKPKVGFSSTQRVDGKRVFIICQSIDGGKYEFTYAKDVSHLDEDFKSISIVFVSTSLGASALLALILFFVLRKLSSPLERLRTATEEIADGNYDSRADESGSDEFSLLAADFNRMAERVSSQMSELEKNAEVKQSMLDNLAHEMRTPLTSIRGYAEYLLNANIDEKEKIEATEYIISEAERLKLIGERLLDDAFIRENGINAENVNLGEIIADITKKMHFQASGNGVELRIEAKSVNCNCDKLLVGMLLSNLIGNAIKACKGNGTVTVGCDILDNKALLYVKDTGIGMSEEQLSRITEPFYRTDKSRNREEGGTGLGLALCERIAKAHNARMSFESTLNEGTTALVEFNI